MRFRWARVRVRLGVCPRDSPAVALGPLAASLSVNGRASVLRVPSSGAGFPGAPNLISPLPQHGCVLFGRGSGVHPLNCPFQRRAPNDRPVQATDVFDDPLVLGVPFIAFAQTDTVLAQEDPCLFFLLLSLFFQHSLCPKALSISRRCSFSAANRSCATASFSSVKSASIFLPATEATALKNTFETLVLSSAIHPLAGLDRLFTLNPSAPPPASTRFQNSRQ